VGNAPLATYADAQALRSVVDAAAVDVGRFTPTQQTQLLAFQSLLQTVVNDGPGQFDQADITAVLGGAVNAVNLLTSGTCDGFLAP